MKSVAAVARERVRSGGGLSGRTWVVATVEVHLELIGMYLGYLVRHHGLDLDGDWDARDVFTIELLDAFVEAVEKHRWTTRKRTLDFIKNISLYASPCWECGALKWKEDAVADGLQRLADYAGGRGVFDEDTGTFDGLTLYKNRREIWTRERLQLVEAMAQKAAAVQKAYEAATGEPEAYIAMLKFRNAMISRFCREVAEARGLEDSTPERMLAAIQAGALVLGVQEFSRMRNVEMYGDELADPNRRNTLSRLDVADRQENVKGEVWSIVPAEKMKVKRNGDHELLLGTRGETHEFRYRFDLWDAYKVAREQFIGDAACDVLYPSTQPGEARGAEDYRLAPESVTTAFRWCVEYGAAELGIDASLITSIAGAAAPHACRHAVASYMVGIGELDLARRMLHHAGVDLLLKVYARNKRPKSASGVLMGMAV